MDECADGVGPDNSQQPGDQENDGYGVQHRDLSLFTYELVSRPGHGAEATGVSDSTQHASNAGECLCSCAHRISWLKIWRSCTHVSVIRKRNQ
jgi:hypothetical protein